MKKITFVSLGITAVFSLASCAAVGGLTGISTSYSHTADSNAGSTKEIMRSYPGAHDIIVVEARGNPNYMQWTTADGKKCTAQASAVQIRTETPGSLVTTPYCR